MAATTEISWTDATFNPWIGCAHVHAGCTHCYAESFAKRYGKAKWGVNGTRVKTSEAYWKQPLKWNKAAANKFASWENMVRLGHDPESLVAQGFIPPTRPLVFCASLADVFEDWDGNISDSQGRTLWECSDCDFISPYAPIQTLRKQWLESACSCTAGPDFVPLGMVSVRKRLFALIDATPNLDWLLLTKRPENVRKMWPLPHYTATYPEIVKGAKDVVVYRKNVWLGTSISDQQTYDELAHDLYHGCRNLSPVLFLSAEPLLGPIKLWHDFDGDKVRNWKGCFDWLICGGESGHHSRPCNVEWIRSIRDQCKSASVPCFVKQLGAAPMAWNGPSDIERWREDAIEPHQIDRLKLRDPKGGDWNEWPEDLRVREFPRTKGDA